MEKTAVLNELILGYRELIAHRYAYKRLKKLPDLPASFDKARVDKFVDYTLEYLYPNLEKRAELDQAFEHLDDYVRRPEKLLRMIRDAAGLVFKYGRHLPKMLKAGLKALRSFKSASDFENRLVEAALASDKQPPFSDQDIYALMRDIPREEIEAFMDSTEGLFQILHDRKLVKKIIEIISTLIKTMEKRSQTYGEVEVNALRTGLDMIVKGNELFGELSEEEQHLIFTFVIDRENEVLDIVFGEETP